MTDKKPTERTWGDDIFGGFSDDKPYSEMSLETWLHQRSSGYKRQLEREFDALQLANGELK